ncbi:L,D-transpeptidase [Akkermansiaceae bacterium]|nr:L,D-transpeptidase [Akkermansiaceae bacterium]
MTLISTLQAISFSSLLVITLSSCGSRSAFKKAEPDKKIVNPHPVGSYEAFKWKNYPGTTRAWKNESLLAIANPSNTKVKIDVNDQRGFLIVGDEIAMDYRISTGIKDRHDTPIGQYRVIERVKDKRSNLYGKILDADGKVIKSDADSREDEVPPDGEFLGAPMLYWMRLTNDGIGMHKGNVTRRYASHGCIRTHYAAIPIVFEKTGIGTSVSIEP